MKRSARLLSETKPAAIKAATWCMIENFNARRRALLAGRGNTLQVKALARRLWKIKNEIGPEVVIIGRLSVTETLRNKKPRLGNPLRNIPKSFTQRTFA